MVVVVFFCIAQVCTHEPLPHSDGRRGDENVEKLLEALKPITTKLLILDEKKVC